MKKQNKAQKRKQTQGHAEKSERGMAEFNADRGIKPEKSEKPKLSSDNVDPSNRGHTEFLEL